MLFSTLTLFFPAIAHNSAKPDCRGLVAGWGAFSKSGASLGQLGLRFLPEFSLEFDLGHKNIFLHEGRSLIYPIALNPASGYNQSDAPEFEAHSSKSTYGAGFALYAPCAASTPSLPSSSSPPSSSSIPFTPVPSTPRLSTITAEFSLDIWGSMTVEQRQENEFRGHIKPYRLSLKYATNRFEARIGLQKISLGSATLLRPLMWFDQIDPRDPIQLTEGVYGLLLRIYISTQTNLWAWILYGNEDPKGWEILRTQNHRPEFGARAQVPAGKGELAFSFHHRHGHYDASNPAASLVPVTSAAPLTFNLPEIRTAVDGKWDLGIGLWFELAFTNYRSRYLSFPWGRALTVGLDYTFAFGNGVHLLGEYFQSDSTTGAFSNSPEPLFSTRFLGASASYPLSLLDSFSAIAFYDTRNHNLYSFVRWQRTYDRWSLYLMAFWNPKEFRIYSKPGQTNLFSGKGFQLLILYNF